MNGKPQVILGKDRGFKFDHVFKPDASQVTIVFRTLLYSERKVSSDLFARNGYEHCSSFYPFN